MYVFGSWRRQGQVWEVAEADQVVEKCPSWELEVINNQSLRLHGIHTHTHAPVATQNRQSPGSLLKVEHFEEMEPKVHFIVSRWGSTISLK